MTTLHIDGLDEKTLARLHSRAVQHGVSMDEEIRRILKQAVDSPERLGDLAVRLFRPAYGEDELELPERQISDPLEFE